MAHNGYTKEKVLELASKRNVDFVSLQFTDMQGMGKNITILGENLEKAFDRGLWFDGSSIEGFARVAESDMHLRPDPSTFFVHPDKVEGKTFATVICDIYKPDNTPFDGDPRHILKNVLEESKKMGYTFEVGPELEFFIFEKDEKGIPRPVPQDQGGYFDLESLDLASDVRTAIIEASKSTSLEIEASHHEVAPGQHEIDFKYSEALTMADNVVTYKNLAKSVAAKFGYFASFMPKPIAGIAGSGMHAHLSLFDFKKKVNAFYGPDNEYNLSKLALYFMGGLLKFAREISGVIAPTVNSYKRLVPGYEAPVYVSWARKNRSALVRVPECRAGKKSGTRLELRCPDPSCNPYLAFAVMLKAGLIGIKEKIEPPKPVEEDVFEFDDAKLKKYYIKTLPGSLKEAVDEMEKGRVVKETLGQETFQKYIFAKKQEWDSYRTSVTDWEIRRYLPVL